MHRGCGLWGNRANTNTWKMCGPRGAGAVLRQFPEEGMAFQTLCPATLREKLLRKVVLPHTPVPAGTCCDMLAYCWTPRRSGINSSLINWLTGLLDEIPSPRKLS